MLNKLKSTRGETFVESLVAVVVVSLATLLFVGLVTAAGNINAVQKKADRDFYSAMSKVERLEGTDNDGNAVSIDVSVTDDRGIKLENVKCGVTKKGSLYAYNRL